MFEKVKEILLRYADTTDIEETSILISDLGLSSFDLVSVITDFEDEFHIEISDRDISSFLKVKDILDYLGTHIC